MRPYLHYGQAPAKGILHVEQRQPMKREVSAEGNSLDVPDPRGYWLGQHLNPARAQRRAAIKAAGGIRQFKRQQGANRG